MREGIWGASLFAVEEGHRGRGVGRELLEACFGHGADAHGHVILSTEHPGAMRRYARLGLDLRPCVATAGIVDRARLPETDGVRVAGPEGIAVADAIGRDVRGAGHGVDLPVLLDDADARLLLVEDRAFAVVRGARIMLIAGRDEAAATRVLNGALAATPPGATVSVDFLTAGQDWAVRAGLDAGPGPLPDGPLFTAGDLGPMRPTSRAGPTCDRGPHRGRTGRPRVLRRDLAATYATWMNRADVRHARCGFGILLGERRGQGLEA